MAIRDEYNNLKEPGMCFFRSWEKMTTYQVFVNGYLLEPIDDKDTYRPLMVSVVGKKHRIDRFLKTMRETELMFPEPTMLNYSKGRSGCYRVLPWFASEKKGALQRDTAHITGTLEYQTVAYRKELFDSTFSRTHLNAYLVGVDEADAQLGFPRLLRNASIPCPMEWIDPLKDAILKHHGWMVELPGHQMTGYKANIPKDELEELLQEMVKNGELPRPRAAA